MLTTKNKQRAYSLPLNATIDGQEIGALGITVSNADLSKDNPGISKATAQKIIMPIPKGDLKLVAPDSRVLRRDMIGREKMLENLMRKEKWGETKLFRIWHHGPSELLIMATVDKALEHGELLHISISYPDHDPTWEEIKIVRSTFFPPFVDVMMMLPDEAYYVNIDEHTFHIVQCPSPWSIG